MINFPNLYIIAGCNGAGKTTASLTVLPEMLGCDEFINADEIAIQLSPLNPYENAIIAGREMLKKIDRLILQKKDFAFETTLASRSLINIIRKARNNGYHVTLVFLWLESAELAKERVKIRVLEGGHHIPKEVIYRRYYSGIRNLFNLYMELSDYWMIFNNSVSPSYLIAEGYSNKEIHIQNIRIFETIKQQLHHDKK